MPLQSPTPPAPRHRRTLIRQCPHLRQRLAELRARAYDLRKTAPTAPDDPGPRPDLIRHLSGGPAQSLDRDQVSPAVRYRGRYYLAALSSKRRGRPPCSTTLTSGECAVSPNETC